ILEAIGEVLGRDDQRKGALRANGYRWHGVRTGRNRMPLVWTSPRGKSMMRGPIRRRYRRSGFRIGQPMRGVRRFAFDQELLGTVERLAVRNARALMLAQMLEPRFVHEIFDVA